MFGMFFETQCRGPIQTDKKGGAYQELWTGIR